MCQISKYQIEMLDVGDADCLIIYIEYSDNTYELILVDGGNYSNGQSIIDHLNSWYPNTSVSIAIVTHPDGDHFGGFIYMLKKIQNGDRDAVPIEFFCVHDPGNHITADDVKRIRIDQNAKDRARQILTRHHDKEDINLLDLIDELGIQRHEVFASESGLHRLGSLTIIGPTEKYYESLVAEFRHNMEKAIQKSFSVGVFEGIDKFNDDPSTHNKSSLIFVFEDNYGKKYLFAGDATEESFQNVPKQAFEYIANCDWLKVPHHGSHHNSSSDLITHISPKTAYISSTSPNEDTIEALKTAGANVYSTSHGGTKLCHGIKSRPGWSSARRL